MLERIAYDGEIKLQRNDKHKYFANGKKIDVSVTGFCKGGADALIQWSANMAAEYFYNQVINSSFTALDLAAIKDDARFAFRRESKAAMDIGSAAHSWVEAFMHNLVRGWNMPDFPHDTEVRQCCTNFLDMIKGHKFLPLESEMMLYSKEFDVAGTLDCIIDYDGVKELWEFKSSKALYAEYRYQMAFYALQWEEEFGEILPRRLIRLGKTDPEVEAILLPEEDQEADELAAISLLNVWRRNKTLEAKR